MSRPRRVHAHAMAELRNAAEWCETQRQGLGAELIDEFDRTLEDALRRLETSAAVAQTASGLALRRFRLQRFSRYAIYVVLLQELPVVVAFEHSSREPGYWHERLR